MRRQKTRNFDVDEVELPAKRVTGDTMREVLTDNAYENILPARYENEDETTEELFQRVAKSVSLADALYHADDQGYEITVTPQDIKPKAVDSRRQEICEEIFGENVGLKDDITVTLTEDNIYGFAYDQIVPDLPQDIQEQVEDTYEEFHDLLTTLSFMPNSPTIMNAGDDFQQLSACFVNSPEDDIKDIHETVKQASEIFQSGGGVGYAFSRLRPYGDRVKTTGGESSGPISFMRTFDQMCGTIAQGGMRRGAQMGILRSDHPDIIQFIHAKDKDVSLAHSLRLNDPDDFTHNSFGEALEEARDLIQEDEDGVRRVPEHLRNAAEGHLSNFNISVGATGEFMEAVQNDEHYTLINPRTNEPHIVDRRTKELYSWFGLGDELEVGEEMTLPAREVFNRITEGAWDNGEPGMIFLDRANEEHSFDVEEHPEHEIEATNPCVAEGTLVNTPDGYRSVEDIEVGDEISTTIGSEPVDEIESHDDYQVYRVNFSDGSYLDVTAEHRFNILDGKEVVDDVPLHRVEEGEYVRLEPATIEEEGNDEEYTQYLKKGVLLGDGCYSPKTLERHNIVKIASSEEDLSYNDHLKTLFANRDFQKDDTSASGKSMNMIMKNGRNIVDELGLNPAKSHNKDFEVRDIETKSQAIGILDGLLATDGNVNLNSNNPQIRWDTSSYEMAQSIRRTLLLLGCHGRITISKKADRGGTIDDRKISANYDKHTVNVSGESARKYAKQTNIERVHPEKGKQMIELQTDWMTTGNTWKAQIESIEKLDDNVSVYDLYCEKSDTWITEGYVSRGCGEQPLEQYEACNLGHINLSTIVSEDSPDWRQFSQQQNGELSDLVESFLDEAVDWDILDRRIYSGTHFLENVVTMSDFPLEEITEKVGNNRKVGLGIMGLAQMYIQMGVKYGTDTGDEVARQLMKYINQSSKQISQQIAVGESGFAERGVFENWDKSKYADPEQYPEWFHKQTGEDPSDWSDGYPVRNHNTTTIAPTGTTSMIGNTSGGCEPIYQVAYYKNVSSDVQGDEMLVEFDDYFLRVLEANDIDVEDVKIEAQELMSQNEFEGVESLETVPNEVGELFVTTGDLSAEQHADVQCALQEGVDSSISKTVNAPTDATPEDAREAFLRVYQNGGKGITYYRDGTRSKQVLTTREDNQDTEDPVQKVRDRLEDGDLELEELIDGVDVSDSVVADKEADQTEHDTDEPDDVDYKEEGTKTPSQRPKSLAGITEKVSTGYGKLYVTINETEEGDPFEVFANIGKSGGYTESFTEATARLISLLLRTDTDPERVVEQIDDIRSPKVAWDQSDQVYSVPDGIALAMRRYLESDRVNSESDIGSVSISSKSQEVDNQEDSNVDHSESKEVLDSGENPECPECGGLSLYYSEGCKTCESCGWSEC